MTAPTTIPPHRPTARYPHVHQIVGGLLRFGFGPERDRDRARVCLENLLGQLAQVGVGASPTLITALDAVATSKAAMARFELSQREFEVLREMGNGKANSQIARELFISSETVKSHARSLFKKLNARDRAHAVATGFREGLLS